jgi:hypothetical protein
MRVAIAQPTYLPWLGYFDLMDQVDAFVLLDSVQFEKQSWQQRNRIKTPIGLQWLTVPVAFHNRFGQQIRNVEIRDPEFARKHLRAIELNYRRSPFFDPYFQDLTKILLSYSAGRLVDLNARLIRWFCGLLDIQTPILYSSAMNQDGRRSELLVNLCKSLGADSYVSPLGSATYLLSDLESFRRIGIDITFQYYEHPVYRQRFPPFCPYASVVDLLLNEGPKSAHILRQGRKVSLFPSQVGLLASSA